MTDPIEEIRKRNELREAVKNGGACSRHAEDDCGDHFCCECWTEMRADINTMLAEIQKSEEWA